jgi:hypothetical protein
MDGENDKLKVVEFKKEPAIDSGLVSFLEGLLIDAKNGQLGAFACTYVAKGDQSFIGHQSFNTGVRYVELCALVSQIDIVKQNVLDRILDVSED